MKPHRHVWIKSTGRWPLACRICGEPGLQVPADMLELIEAFR